MHWLAVTVCGIALFCTALSNAADITFAEDFALAKDRAETLKKLIPGTEDYFYYHALHYLNTEQYDKAAASFKPWYDRFNQSARLTEIQTRHALLTYEKNPQQSLDYFKSRLGLTFNHQRIVQGGAPNLPTVLDPKAISRDTLAAHSLVRWRQGTDNYEDTAIDWLLTEQIDAGLRRHILARLTRPDFANLAKIVNADLTTEHSGGFGSFPIHTQMTLVQLEELLKLNPDLLNQSNFVQAWVAKLHPDNDSDWRRNPAQTKAYLDRLLAFTRKLVPAFNPLKAHVLYHRLVLDQSLGTMDKAIFLEYLKLPRFQAYMSKKMLDDVELQRRPADLNANYTPWTLLPVVGPDESLVRSYLKYFLVEATSIKEFEPFINDIYLKHLLAETKIENGLGENERWAAELPPELYRQLKDRIDIDFAATNKTSFAADEAVTLDLFVKNVPALMVKVYEINTLNFYRSQQREVDTAINLDGLVANAEKTHIYTETPFRRVGRKFEFPQLNKPGVYVIDFIGSGKSSRALVRKGRLRTIAGTSTAGQKLTIVDDADQPVPAAIVWMGGQEYKANDKGVVVVPFSTAPGQTSLVISKGDLASLDALQNQAESYSLIAGIHVDRESLLTQRIASVVVRPSLRLNSLPVSLKLLEEVNLLITATDHDGIATSTTVPDFKLFEDRESVHDFRVPPRLASLTISLRAKVKSLSLGGKQIDMVASESFSLNGIARTDKIEDLHLAKFGDSYAIELLGRTGEAKPDRPVRLAFKHREFREPINVLLKSDAQGRINLGPLLDIATIKATGPEEMPHVLSLPLNRHTYRQAIHAKAGEIVSVPYLGTADKPARAELALFEVRGATTYADRFDALSIKEGMIEATGLAPGDYDLWLKTTGERIRIRIVDGPVQAGHVLGKLRHLQLPALKPVQIADITADADFVTIRLRDFSSFTRLHVYGTRYLPAFNGYANLAKVRAAELDGTYPRSAESIYLAGRNIGDEYRYVLDRRNQKKYPGNMLERPALLLNPWVLRSTETGEQMAQEGEEFQKKLKESGGDSLPKSPAPAPGESAPAPGGDFANLDYLYDASATLLNLVPDKLGVVKIRRKDLGAHAMIHVLAIDPVNTTARSMSLPEQKAIFLDLRLKNGLDPSSHFTQQKQTTLLPAGQPFVLADAAASRFEAYDSLAKVYGLYMTLSHDPKLTEFAFVLKWPTLKQEEKQTLYSKFACHELSFFIAKKDPEFFKSVVKPYLANKKDKTFLDRWLLETDLSEYLQPWQHSRLNAVERILLAQRLAGEPVKTARHLNDLLRLLPPDVERNRHLFETAVKAGDLSMNDKLKDGLRDANGVTPVLAPAKPESRPAAEKPAGPVRSGAGAGFGGPGGMGGMPSGGKQGGMGRDPAKQDESNGEESKKREGRSLESEKGFLRDQKILQGKDGVRGERFFDDERDGKEAPARLYRKVDPTLEYAENNYYKLPIQQQLASLIPVSNFWVDYVKHEGNAPFLSRNLAEPSRNFTEMMFALAVLDLPFTAAKHEVIFEAGKMTFTPGGQVVAFHEEVKPVAGIGDKVQILVSQNFYRAGDRYRDENGERFDKFVTDEFVIHTVYGCQVVVTNPTPSRQRLSVLIQIPIGALPVANGQPTKAVPLDLEPYRTQVIDFQFYFPMAGQFAHFPAHVARSEKLVAATAPFRFNVVDKPTKLDTDSWDYVSQNGTAEQVIAMMGRENVNALDLEKIAFRMRDQTFFDEVLAVLKTRHAWHATLWSYGLFHKSVAISKEYLTHVDRVVAECGGPIVSPLFTLDPVARYQYEHLEYKPLVNARAHSLGQIRQIVNGRLYEQYHHFMKLLTYRTKLTDDDQLAVAYYLLLQDRIEEASEAFARVNLANVSTKMQYDYCAAYLDFFTAEPKAARAIAMKYANHPVDRWRNSFAAIINQLDEIEGKVAKIADKDDPAQQQAILAAKEPSFDFTLDAKAINATWKNVETIRINYYLMDVELLFSRNPFVQQSGGQFSMIRPNESVEVKLPAAKAKMAIPLPTNLATKNVLIEIVANGKSRSLPYYANAMTVTMNENYGQLQVTDGTSGKSLAKVYVKTYVRLADGSVKFHKDGYTDLRGKFDYASVSTPERGAIAKYSILVLSETQGALIREASPPQQ